MTESNRPFWVQVFSNGLLYLAFVLSGFLLWGILRTLQADELYLNGVSFEPLSFFAACTFFLGLSIIVIVFLGNRFPMMPGSNDRKLFTGKLERAKR